MVEPEHPKLSILRQCELLGIPRGMFYYEPKETLEKNLSRPRRGAAKYPYLLKDKTIWLPNQLWASDITYIRLSSGTVYLVSIIDVYSRKILSFRVSNTMDTEFCVAAVTVGDNIPVLVHTLIFPKSGLEKWAQLNSNP